jgi:hypothetical protein
MNKKSICSYFEQKLREGNISFTFYFKYKQTLQSEAFAADHTLITIVHRSKNFWGKQLLQGILRFVVFDGVYGSVEAKNSVLAKLDSG